MKTANAVLLGFLCAATLLSPAGAQPAALSPAANLIRIGAAAAVHGAVQAAAPGAVGRVVQSGKPLYLNDHVTTDADGRLQVMLLDETIFTIGPDSDMVLDEFVYDPATSAGKVTARVTKGVFRFVTGKVARKTPANMKVDLPVGTIGIRGTIAEGVVDEHGATVILDGPGAQNNTNDTPGAIVVSAGVDPVMIDRPGYGVTIHDGQLSPVSDMSQKAQQISGSLETKPESKTKTGGGDKGQGGASAPGGTNAQTSNEGGPNKGSTDDQARDRGGENKGSAEEQSADRGGPHFKGSARDQAGDEGGPHFKGSVSDQAGQTTADAGKHVHVSVDDSILSTTLNNTTTKTAAQDVTSIVDAFSLIDNQTSKWQDVLKDIPAGAGHYSGSGSVVAACGGACSGTSTGSMSFDVAIDFGARTIGGSGSSLNFFGTGFSGFTTINATPFGSSGKAVVNPSFSNSSFNGTTINLVNADDVPAAGAVVNLNYQQTGFSPSTPFRGSAGTLTVTGTGAGAFSNGRVQPTSVKSR